MIFVTVGTQKFQMDRLIGAVDAFAQREGVNERIFVQIGHSGQIPAHCDYAPFLSKDDMADKIAKCSVMISHGGVGSILMGVRRQAKVIVVPRLKRYGEHVDDHQLEIAQSFADAGYIRMVTDVADLAAEIERCKDWKPMRFESNKAKFSELLLGILDE